MRVGLFLLLAFIVLGIAGAALFSEVEIEAVTERIAEAGHLGGLIIIALMVLHTFIPFPAELVAFAAGAAFGTVMGTVYVWIGAMLGALLGFAIARRLGQDAVGRLLSERQADKLQAWQGRNGVSALIAARLIPIIAFNLINLAAGLSTVRLWTFVWTTAIGILPLTTVMVWFGASMRELDWPLVVMISLAGLAMIGGLHWWMRRRSG